MPERLARSRWARLVVSAGVWTLAYTVVWGLAWFAFMRSEWMGAAVGRALPWGSIWVVWLALSAPLGLGSMGYVLNHVADARGGLSAAVAAGLVVWVPLTLGMTVWAARAPLPWRVVFLDSIVNLGALLAASLLGWWAQRALYYRRRSPLANHEAS